MTQDRRRTAALATLLLSMFISLMGLGVVIPLLPVYAESLGASGLAIGLMVAAFSISRGVLQPFVGGLSDKHGRKRFLLAGLLTYSVVGLLFPLATGVEHLVVIRVVHGVGAAMITPIAMSYVGDLAPPGEEGRYMGMFNIALFSGIGTGPVVGGVFRDTLGFDAAFYAMTVASTVALALVFVMLPSDRHRERRASRPPLLTTLSRMVGNVKVMGVLLSRMSTMIIVVPTFAFLPILMTRIMDASGVQIGAVIAARTLVNATLQVPVGPLVDRSNKIHTLVAGSLVIVAALFAIPFAENFVHLIALFVLMGAGEAFVWPTLGALAIEEGRTYGQGSMMGVFNMSMSAGVFIGSVTAGVLVDSFGVEYAFPAVAVVLLAATAAATTMISVGMRSEHAVPASRFADRSPLLTHTADE